MNSAVKWDMKQTSQLIISKGLVQWHVVSSMGISQLLTY